MKVVLVDDDDLLRVVLFEYLSDAGIHVVPCANAAEALAACARDDVSLLITDVTLRGEDGFALAKAVRRLRRGLPVLFISGFTRQQFGTRIGATDRFLAKPFRPSELLPILHRLESDQSRRAA